ncbi:MAG: sugar phosphate isomerase/epimerase [Clostridia bacterium]|nr:sugar phosphate isomerase/epimerase [Clostridia bacterium]
MKLGLMLHLDENVEAKFADIESYGIPSCQLCCWNHSFFTDEYAEKVRNASARHHVEITAVWCGWDGPAVWDFHEGPLTLGIVPMDYRYDRMKQLKRGSDFAKKIGVTDLITHVGFLPENPKTTEYTSLVAALRDIAYYCKGNGQNFLFETGQETPITLKRTIEDVGTGNLGINLDPANLLLYGKANPCDAVDVFGEYVRNVHGKDGEYPTCGKYLGEEKRIGDGRANFPLLLAKLKEKGYDGPITIEREISGDQQIKDILYAKDYLTAIIEKL